MRHDAIDNLITQRLFSAAAVRGLADHNRRIYGERYSQRFPATEELLSCGQTILCRDCRRPMRGKRARWGEYTRSPYYLCCGDPSDPCTRRSRPWSCLESLAAEAFRSYALSRNSQVLPLLLEWNAGAASGRSGETSLVLSLPREVVDLIAEVYVLLMPRS